MAKVYQRNSDLSSTVNAKVSTGAEAMFNIKECLKQAGWTVAYSGDGVGAFGQFTDVISGFGSGANGLANSNAYFVMQEPAYASGTAGTITNNAGTVTLDDAGASFQASDVGAMISINGAVNGANNGSFRILAVNSATQVQIDNAAAVNESGVSWWISRREILFQRGTSDRSWRVFYSAVDHFIGGTPSATVAPTATDQQQVIGTGGNFNTAWWPTDGTYMHHMVALDVPESGVYGFYSWCIPFGTSSSQKNICLVPMANGSFPANTAALNAPNGDIDPCVLIASTVSPAFSDTNIDNAYGWYKKGFADEAWVQFDAHLPIDSSGKRFANAGVASQPGDGLYSGFPVIYGRSSSVFGTQIGYKGTCAHLLAQTQLLQFPTVLDIATDARVAVDDMLVPWPDNVEPEV